MKCKKGQVVMTADIRVSTRNHLGKKLKFSNAEKHVENVLRQVFQAFVKNYDKKLAVSFDGTVEVLTK